jgi:hypothetical protein
MTLSSEHLITFETPDAEMQQGARERILRKCNQDLDIGHKRTALCRGTQHHQSAAGKNLQGSNTSSPSAHLTTWSLASKICALSLFFFA